MEAATWGTDFAGRPHPIPFLAPFPPISPPLPPSHPHIPLPPQQRGESGWRRVGGSSNSNSSNSNTPDVSQEMRLAFPSRPRCPEALGA